MPSAKSGNAVTAVEPVQPVAPEEADTADPGEVEEIRAEQREAGTGKYGSATVTPFVPPEHYEGESTEYTWIEIELVDENDDPVPGERYRVTLPDGRVAEGTLNIDGFARIAGFEPGSCTVTFPDLDEEAWEEI